MSSGDDAPASEPESEDTADAEDTAAAENAEDAENTADAERYGCPVSDSRGQAVIHPDRDSWFDTAAALLADGWNMCVDVTAVDYSAYQGSRNLPAGVQPQRFEVVAAFVSHTRRERLRARVQVPADEPSVASLYPLYPGTDFLEREVYDLFGIEFVGHPDLSRILMPETWEGHPLRKDYAVGAIPVQFKAPAN